MQIKIDLTCKFNKIKVYVNFTVCDFYFILGENKIKVEYKCDALICRDVIFNGMCIYL